MAEVLSGSELTRAMLARGDEQVWCAVADNSDEEALQDLTGNDFTAFIVSFENDCFYCSGGMEWGYAVPIKIVALTQQDVGVSLTDSLTEFLKLV